MIAIFILITFSSLMMLLGVILDNNVIERIDTRILSVWMLLMAIAALLYRILEAVK